MLIDKLTAEINRLGYQKWSFTGDIVAWHYLNGQVIIKNRVFEIITSDVSEPTTHRFMGGTIRVHAGTPTPTVMPERPEGLAQKPVVRSVSSVCSLRGEQIETLEAIICKGKTIELPVYACPVHEKCVDRKVCGEHAPEIHTCIGCQDRPYN